MAENKTTDIKFSTKVLTVGAKAATTALKGLNGVLSSVGEGIKEAFTVEGFEDYKDTVTRFGKELADELLVLQLSFGKMKYAIAEAVAPLASVFVPILNSAIQGVIRFSSVVNQFLRGIIAGITGRQELTASAEGAAEAEEKLSSAAAAAGKAMKRSLAGFDQINRLNGATGSGSNGSTDVWGGYTPDPISQQVQAVVDKVLALLAPLMAIDLQPLYTALQTLGVAFSNLAAVAGEELGFLWHELLTPFAAWVLEALAPALTEGFAAKLELVTAAIAPVVAGLKILWEALKPVVAFIGEVVVQILEIWKNTYVRLTEIFREKTPIITGIFQNIAQMASAMWVKVSPVLSALANLFYTVFDGVSEIVAATVGYILDALYCLTEFLTSDFSGSWQEAWQGAVLFLKSAVNGVITLLNSMISRLVSALNAVVRTANKLSFTVPEWVPNLGGKRFGVNFPTVTAPKIPYLAKGAVLPAGKPFLAMVGDQHHGTNVEAPLSTIQEAVAVVMEDQTAAILRGFEASVGVQKEILEAVLGIRIGDEVLGRAVSRYNRRMGVMQGGY